MATKTLRVTLADILGPAGPAGRVHGEVWARFVDANGAPREVRYTDGTVVTIAQARVPLDSSGVADFVVVPNDDATVHVDDQGFGVQVGWDLTYRGDQGARVQVKNTGKTVAVTSSSPSVAQYGLLATFVPVIVGTSYITQGTADANYPKKSTLQINVKDYGAVGDNVATDTTAFTSAITAAAAAKLPLYIPGGHYKITSTLDIPDGLIMFGAGSEPTNGTPTRLNFSTLTGATAAITVIDGSSVVLRDFYVTGRTSGSGNEIQFTGNSRTCTIERVTVNTSTTGAALSLANGAGSVIQSRFSQVKTVGAANGILVGGACTSLHFESCYSMSATNAGYLIQGTYLSFNACACDQSSLYGYLLQNCVGVSFNGCGAESNARTGWHLTNAKHVVLNGCRGVNNNTSANVLASSFMGINDASDYVTAIGCIDTTPNAATSNSVRNWNGTAPTVVNLFGCDFSAKGVNANTAQSSLAAVTTTTAPSAGGAGALPATPLGYATVTINGTARKVAYY